MIRALKNMLIIWSVFITHLAYSAESVSMDSRNFMIENLDQIVSTKESILDFTKNASLEKYEELNKFMAKEKISESFKFPKLKYQSGKYEFTLEGSTVYFEAISKNQVLVKFNEKSIKVDSTMSLETMKKTVEGLFRENQKTTFFNYFISNAQAQLLIGEALLTAAILASVVAFVMLVNYTFRDKVYKSAKKKELEKLVKSSRDICGQIEAAQNEIVQSDKLLEAYNSLSKNYSTICSALEQASNSQKAVCSEAETVKKCLKDSINRLYQVDNSKRNEVKKVYYDEAKDVYTNAVSK